MAQINFEVVVRSGDQLFKRFVLDLGRYLIGRAPDCGIQVDSPDVSHRHARIDFQEDHFWVEDLGSSNGLFLDGQRLQHPMRLSFPQDIMVGSVTLHIDRLTTGGQHPSDASIDAPQESVKTPRNYKIQEIVARGGMGAILHAEDLNIRRAVAMKTLLSGKNASHEGVLRFLQEARVLGQLEHPNIVPIHELGLDDEGQVFYTMKFVRGDTLAQVLNELEEDKREAITKYPLAQLLTVFQKVCDAISFAHSKGVIHRDLKPANIMLGDFGEVLVMDWGLAKIRAAPNNSQISPAPTIKTPSAEPVSILNTMEGQVMGTPSFMAPEQAEGRVADIDARTDVFALGGILYNLLTLHPPITGTELTEVIARVKSGDIRPPKDFDEIVREVGRDQAGLPKVRLGVPHCPGGKIPQALSAVALKALALHPSDRYQTVAELQMDISAYQNGFVTSAEQPSAMLLTQLWIKRHKGAMVALAGAAMLAMVFLVILAMMWLELRGTARTFYEKSQALIETGKFSEALAPINYAIRLDGGRAEYHYLRGNILESLLHLDAAQKSYRVALTLAPRHKLAEDNLQLCQQILGVAAGQNPLPFSALSTLYEGMLLQGRSEEAQGIATRLLKQTAGPRKALYARWRARLDHAGIGGTLMVDRRKDPRQASKTVIDWPRQRLTPEWPTTGFFGNRILELDGQTSYVEFPQDIFNALDGATVEAWVKWRSLPSDPTAYGASRIFSYGEKFHDTAIQGGADTGLEFFLSEKEGHAVSLRAPGAIRTNKWYHVAAVSGRSGMKLFVDGVVVATNRFSGSFSAISKKGARLRFGHSVVDDEPFLDGQLAEVRVWNVARTPAQIHDNLFKDLTGKEEGLVGLWNFNDGNANDSSPAGHHGKLIGRARVMDGMVWGFSPRGNVRGLSNSQRRYAESSDAGDNSLGRVIRAWENEGVLLSSYFPPNGNIGSVDEDFRVELIVRPVGTSDISALKGMPLNALALDGTKVTSLKPLMGMPLDWLSLRSTEVMDLRPLKGMHLKYLDLWNSKASDLTSLLGMSLEQIILPETVEDIRPLAGMPIGHIDGLVVNDMQTLRSLPLEGISLFAGWGGWDLSDLPRLRELPTLRDLTIYGCRSLTNIAALHGLPLIRLALDPAQITDLTPLKGMKLERLLLSGAPVTDITPLAGMPLNRLDLLSTHVSDIRCIAGMPLEHLALWNAPVHDLTALRGLPLLSLELVQIPATDFRPLAGLKLVELRLSNTKFADLTLISSHSLRALYLNGCSELHDLSPLLQYTALEIITLPSQVKDLELLRQMPALRWIGFSEASLQPVAEFWRTYDARAR